MVELKNLNDLCEKIRVKLFEGNIDVLEKVKKILVSPEKYTVLEFTQIKADLDRLKELVNTPAELYWFAKAIEDVDNTLLKVSDYFTDDDIKQYKVYIRKKININDLYILHNVHSLTERQWTATLSVEQIALMSKYKIIRTDPNLQRRSCVQSVNKETNEIIRKISVNPKRVEEIKNCLITNNYAFNTIRLNLIEDGECAIKLVEEKQQIILPKNGDCIVLDGNHRRQACEQAYFSNPELKEMFANQYFQIAFTFFPPRKARQIISQEWDTEKITTNHIKAMKINFSNEIVDAIIRSEVAERVYADKITTTGHEWRLGTTLIIYSDLSEAINKYYKTNSFKLKSEAMGISNWLIEFYNYIAEKYIDDFSDVRKSAAIKWITNRYMMSYGFVYLSKFLQNKKEWKFELDSILERIDFSRTASPIDSGKNKSNAINIEIYLKGILENV